LFRDAVAQSDIEVTMALQLLADRVEALRQCEIEHSGGMMPMALIRLQVRHSEITKDIEQAQQFVAAVRARMLDRKIEKDHK
jgi:hypothetical protein